MVPVLHWLGVLRVFRWQTSSQEESAKCIGNQVTFFWRMDYGMGLYIQHTATRYIWRRLAKPNPRTHVSFLPYINTIALMRTRQRPVQLYVYDGREVCSVMYYFSLEARQ